MHKLLILCLLLFLHHGEGKRLINVYKDIDRRMEAPLGADVGEPLILTPFIKNGSILEGKQAALVHGDLFGDVLSYAGYFTVDENFDSNMWFWFFPSEDNPLEDPVILWLTGGPGGSGLYGLFDEHGPFIVDNTSVSLREYSWNKNHSVIYVDNPVGTGFSFTNGGYAQNETKVGADLYSALIQFFQLFPDLQKNPFYASGESYAGKYLPAIGHTILQNNPNADLKINLQGILIGDGWVDPVNQMNYGTMVYNTGLVSEAVREEIDEHMRATIELFQKGDYLGSFNESNIILDLINDNSLVSIYNYLQEEDGFAQWMDFVNTEEPRRALHVGNTTFSGGEASEALDEDEMQSVVPWLEELLENYRVILYTGQLDIICGYRIALDYIQKLKFSGAEAYRVSPRKAWRVDDEVAGYVKTGGNLVELLVRNSGHMVPKDQPKWAYDLIYKFTRNIPIV